MNGHESGFLACELDHCVRCLLALSKSKKGFGMRVR